MTAPHEPSVAPAVLQDPVALQHRYLTSAAEKALEVLRELLEMVQPSEEYRKGISRSIVREYLNEALSFLTAPAATQEPVTLEAVRGACARGWCAPLNSSKVMDSDLALAIADEVFALFTAPVAAPSQEPITDARIRAAANAAELACEQKWYGEEIMAGMWQEDVDLMPHLRRFAVALAAPQDATQAQDAARSQAARDVLAERQRQIAVEGWTPEHDDGHRNGELAFAAVAYAEHAAGRSWVIQDFTDGELRYQDDEAPNKWPHSWSLDFWKPKSRRADLVRAAALLIAEIERLDRQVRSAAPTEAGGTSHE